MASSTVIPHPHHRTHVVSSTPSRTRLRVSAKRRNATEMHRIAEALRQQPGVQNVSTNMATGSVVVQHEPTSNAINDISSTLWDVGVVLFKVLGAELPSDGKSEAANDVVHAVADLNERVRQATDGVIDLRFLIPLGLGGLAVHQLLRNGLQIEGAPWYVLAYYAFDSFIKLHYTQDKELQDARRKVESAAHN